MVIGLPWRSSIGFEPDLWDLRDAQDLPARSRLSVFSLVRAVRCGSPVDHNDTITNATGVVQQADTRKAIERCPTMLRTYPQVRWPLDMRCGRCGLRRITYTEIRASPAAVKLPRRPQAGSGRAAGLTPVTTAKTITASGDDQHGHGRATLTCASRPARERGERRAGDGDGAPGPLGPA